MHAYVAIDPQALLTASANDTSMFCTLAQIFLDTAPGMFERMEQASAQAASLDAFIAASHALRGITVLVGAHDLTAQLTSLERAAGLGACPAPGALTGPGALLALVCAEVRHSIGACAGAAS
jgi:hypothetical protein